MMNEEFKSCFYCKYYKDGKCLRLTEDIDFDYGFDVLFDKYISESDIDISAEEYLFGVVPNTALIKGILSVLDSNNVRIGLKKREQIKSELTELIDKYNQKFISGASDFAGETVMNLKEQKGLIKEVTQLQVEPTFYCKHWR